MLTEEIECSTLDLIPKFTENLPQKIKMEDVDEFENFLSKIMDEDDAYGSFIRVDYNPELKSFLLKRLKKKNTPEGTGYNRLETFLKCISKSLNINNTFTFFTYLNNAIDPKHKNIDKFIELTQKVPFLVTDIRIQDNDYDSIRVYKNAILVPDYLIIDKLYSETVPKISESLLKIDKTKIIDKAGFAGVNSGGMISSQNLCSSPRIRLCMHTLLFPNYVDSKFTAYNYNTTIRERSQNPNGEEEWKKLMIGLLGKPHPTVPFEQMIYYKYNASCDGWTSAWQRVPWIMFTKTVLLMQTNWKQFFYPILQEGPGGHYFKLKDDMSNLISTIDYLRNNPEIYEKMTTRAYNFAQKNLTPEAITTYYKTMLTKIAERFI